jgi:hypothetical protein
MAQEREDIGVGFDAAVAALALSSVASVAAPSRRQLLSGCNLRAEKKSRGTQGKSRTTKEPDDITGMHAHTHTHTCTDTYIYCIKDR